MNSLFVVFSTFPIRWKITVKATQLPMVTLVRKEQAQLLGVLDAFFSFCWVYSGFTLLLVDLAYGGRLLIYFCRRELQNVFAALPSH
jgi:hypothetical protein